MSDKKPTICPTCKKPVDSYTKLQLGSASIVMTEELSGGVKLQQTHHFSGGTRETFGPCGHIVITRVNKR